MSGSLHYDDIHISEKWFDIGETTQPSGASEIAFKFIAYWIAFNGLFSNYELRDRDEYESDLIERLVHHRFSDLEGLIDFDKDSACEIFREAPVFTRNNKPRAKTNYLNMLPDKNGKIPYTIELYQQFMKSRDEKERLIALLLTVKQVRNNLFHGQKNPTPERNYSLVDSSQDILRRVLEVLL